MKHITKIEYIDDVRCRVILDSFDVLELDTFTVSTSPLKEGEDFEDEVLEGVIFECDCIKAQKESIKYLSSRMRTAKQLAKHLAEKGYDGKIIDLTIDRISSWGYIDDASYARTFIEYRLSSSKKSWRAIEYDLKLEGVEKDVIVDVLSEYERDESERAFEVAQKIVKDKRDEKTLKRLQGSLARNGFYWDAISYALKQLGHEEDEDWNE